MNPTAEGRMKVKDAVRKAIETNDAALAGRIVDRLRFGIGMQYKHCYEVFRRNAPMPDHFTMDDFEALMMGADEKEAQS